MKELYEMPKLEIIAFEEDIVTTSRGGDWVDGEMVGGDMDW